MPDNLTPQIIKGSSASDERGIIRFVNDFDMGNVKRFYIIKHPFTTTLRGWRGHNIEQRWFYVSTGSFKITCIAIDNWEAPNKNSKQSLFTLESKNSQVLHIPSGYVTCLQALKENSEIIVFGDHTVDHAAKDDHLFPIDYFTKINRNED